MYLNKVLMYCVFYFTFEQNNFVNKNLKIKTYFQKLTLKFSFEKNKSLI